MDEEVGSSWIRRAKFSHTVCHRFDSSRLGSVPLAGLRLELSTRVRTDLAAPSNSSKNPASSSDPQIQYNPLTNKLRSISPIPRVTSSSTFKEARSSSKRFSTPPPRRVESDKGIMRKLIRRDSRESQRLSISSAKQISSPLCHLVSNTSKADKKNKKDSAWTKYFDHGGGKVTAVETADDYMLDLSKLLLGLKFAYGAHSRLYHGIYKDKPVAVKIITLPDDDDNKALASTLEKQFNTEVTLLSRLRHPNVIKFVAACRKSPVFCIVTEYLSEGSLRAYLHKLEHETLPLKKLVAIALGIARGMEYVHSQGLIHRDLKPENVLIDDVFHMKVADFGIACEEAYCDILADDPGTYRWMAPEMIKHRFYCRKVDVYSFGLILWELVSGHIPYEDMSPIQAAYAVANKNLRPCIPKDCHPAMRALIEQCWSSNPDRRPEFWQVVMVLEQFESSITSDGALNVVQSMLCLQDHKKGLLRWIQKLSPSHSSSIPKPKFH